MNYELLKFIGQVCIPALITCIITIMAQLGCEYTETVGAILTALMTCYNSIIVYWNKEYYKEQAQSSEGQDK